MIRVKNHIAVTCKHTGIAVHNRDRAVAVFADLPERRVTPR